jgi:hypothetical protein
MNRVLIMMATALGLTCSGMIGAQPISSLQQLQAKVIELQRVTNIPSTPEPFVDCSRTSAEQLDRSSAGGAMQYIYNAMYEWKSVITPNGRCIYLVVPENRGLTSAEATALITAGGMQFPLPPNPGEQTDPAIIKKMRDEDPALHATVLPDPLFYVGRPQGH